MRRSLRSRYRRLIVSCRGRSETSEWRAESTSRVSSIALCKVQEGGFYAAFAELKSNGLEKEEAGFRIDQYGERSYKVFFVVAPDGLCYCLGERQTGAGVENEGATGDDS